MNLKKSLLFVPISLSLTITGCSAQQVDAPNKNNETASPSPTYTKPPAEKSSVTIPNRKNHVTDLTVKPISLTTGEKNKILNADIEGDFIIKPKLVKEKDNSWAFTQGQLKIDNQYTVKVTSVNEDGVKNNQSLDITTFTPKKIYSPTVFPVDDQTVGVGMPITINFKKPVTGKENRKRIEEKLTVKTVPAQKGSWGWIENNSMIVWKPEKYWKPGTKVSVNAPLEGISYGNDQYGKKNFTTNFKIGRELILKTSNRTKETQVIENGKVIRTMPVSMGKTGHETSSGTNIIYEKANPTRMVGQDYDLIVKYAQRYNTTGEYFHSAPWSVGDQGVRNVSHGCINLSPQNAKWLYGKTIVGDLVQISGTGRKAATWDGMGAMWNMSNKEWRSLSAL